MHHFQYRNGLLHAEDVPLSQIADAVGTPVYIYSTATLTRHYRVFAGAFDGLDALICYAVKANGNIAVLRTLAELGAGADVVSEGELRRALAAGVPPNRIVFSGVGKTRDELAFAIATGILQINVESENELELLNTVAGEMDRIADIAIRVNPDVDARTHSKISTGKKENKFGVDIARAPEIYRRAMDLPGVRPVSLAVHIGSQLTDLDPYRAAFRRVAECARALVADGVTLRRVDLGGGLGITYEDEAPPHPDDYARVVREEVGPLGLQVVLEPGRLIVGNAGVLLSRVIYVKQGEARRFVVLDAAMNDLIRPAMYGSHHAIVTVEERPTDASLTPADVVGPVCESGDTFARARLLPQIRDGELVALASAGAYGAVMASSYNSRPLAPEVLVNGSEFAVVRPRQTYAQMLDAERFADWQTAGRAPAAPRAVQEVAE